MYCPNCGDQTTQGLKYCKRCGAGLSASTTPIEGKASVGLGVMIMPVALVSIAGFIALFTTVYSLGDRPAGFDARALIAIMAFGGATVVGVVGMFVWLLLRLMTFFQGAAHQPAKTEKQVNRDYIPQLSAPPIGMPSVTENTTRNFDPAKFVEQRSRE